MNLPLRKFTAAPAVRESVPLLIGLFGPSASGKTFSALRLATGIQKVSGGKIFCIDTESRRALHYADDFRFDHIQFDAPFGSLDYLQAIRWCAQQGAKVIIVDSMTHEHIGEGGYLQTQEAELDRLAGHDMAARNRVNFLAWAKPSKMRQQMITGILQLNANLIFCFRAKEKIKPIKGGGVQEQGFMPIAGEELLFEMTANCLLLPKSGGVPTWRSDQVGERLVMKLPRQFEKIFAEQKPLDEDIGAALAQWARGNQSSSASSGGLAEADAPSGVEQESSASGGDDFFGEGEPSMTELDERLGAAAQEGTKALRAEWSKMNKDQQKFLKAALELRHKPKAVEADGMLP